jgi:hypothetical protein
VGTFIGKVAAVFTANTSGLVTGTREASAALAKMESNVKGISTGMDALVAIEGARLFAGVATQVGNVAGSFVRMNAATAEVIDAQSKLSRKIGVSLADFQSLALAGDLAGVSQEKIANAVGKMGINLVKASEGSKGAVKAFESLGLSVADLEKMSPADRFQAIATAISGLKTPAEQAAAAVNVFGKGGKDLLDIFANGGAAVKEAAEYAELFGVALSTEAGQNVEKMMDDFTTLGKVVEGFKNQLVAAFAPAVSEQITGVIEKIKELGGIKTVAQDTAIFLAEAAGKFIDAGTVFASKIDTVLTALQKSVDAIAGLGAFLSASGKVLYSAGQAGYAVTYDVASAAVGGVGEESRRESEALWGAAYATREAAERDRERLQSALYGTNFNTAPPQQTTGEGFAATVRAAVERERAAAAERDRAREASAATDSKKNDGVKAAESKGDGKAEQTLEAQLKTLREVAANTAKAAVFKVFNITGAGAR